MTALKKKDIIKILTLIRANYDNAYSCTSPEEAELLINFWYDCLNQFSYEAVYEATKLAISKSEFIPRLANIVAEAKKISSANSKSNEQLWAELIAVLPTVYDISRYLPYPQHHNNAQNKITEIYNALETDLKLYVINTSTLIELSTLTEQSLAYEKARFFKQMPLLRTHAADVENAQRFLGTVESQKRLAGGDKND